MHVCTPIADLVESMLADGIDHAAVVRAVRAAEASLRKRYAEPKQAQGNRLPADWWPSESLVAYAAAHGLSDSRITREAEKFKNYWSAKTGAGAVKRDWDATWRNWILNAMEGSHVATVRGDRSTRAIGFAGRPSTGANAVLAGMGRLAHRLAETRMPTGPENRQVASSADLASTNDVEDAGT